LSRVNRSNFDARHESWKARLPKNETDLWDALTALDGTAQASGYPTPHGGCATAPPLRR